MVATECVDRIATMKPRTGVIWDLTPTDVGWATGARTKAREDVHLPTMDQRWQLVMVLVLRLVPRLVPCLVLLRLVLRLVKTSALM